MKVITIREPWASLIGERIKTIETRSWPTNYRGELYIHAGKHPIQHKDERISRLCSYLSTPNNYQFGFIFLKCVLTDCILIDQDYADYVKKSNPKNFDCGDYSVGRYAWLLDKIEPIKPIEAIGHLSIWNYNP